MSKSPKEQLQLAISQLKSASRNLNGAARRGTSLCRDDLSDMAKLTSRLSQIACDMINGGMR